MNRQTIATWSLLCVSLLIGCSEAADDAALTNSEAAAMVSEETKATPAVFNAEGAPTITFSVPNMMCEQSCVPTVRETLAAQPGAKEVKVELETKTATVAVEEGKFDPQAAVAALVDLQFTETKLVTVDATGSGDANKSHAKPASSDADNAKKPTS